MDMKIVFAIFVGILINIPVAAFRILRAQSEEENGDLTFDGVVNKVIGWILILGIGSVSFALYVNGTDISFYYTCATVGLLSFPRMFVEKYYFHAEPTRNDWHNHIISTLWGLFWLILGIKYVTGQ